MSEEDKVGDFEPQRSYEEFCSVVVVVVIA